jgi:hypothetical protein
MISIERKILFSAATLNLETRQKQKICHLLSQDVDVDHLITLALKEGVAGLLYKNLVNLGMIETLGPQQIETLQAIYYRTVAFNLKLIHNLKKVLHQLNQRRIQVVLLQGIELLQQIYDDIGLRPLTDIDLWISQEEYGELVDILFSEGYLRDSIYPNTFRKGSTIFDIHTHILWADRIEARHLLINKTEADIIHDTRIIDIEGLQARCLSPYDQIIYLSLHALKHCVNRLIWLVDVKGVIDRWNHPDWEAFMDRTRELGQERTITFIFFLLHHLFGGRLPLEARQFLDRERPHFLENKILMERLKSDSLPFWAPVILFTSGKGLKTRLLVMFETIFPRPEILRQTFPSSAALPVWKLYWKRSLQIFIQMKLSLKGFLSKKR